MMSLTAVGANAATRTFAKREEAHTNSRLRNEANVVIVPRRSHE
jgi:hypothetical protein